jgi:hypothetical protein
MIAVPTHNESTISLLTVVVVSVYYKTARIFCQKENPARGEDLLSKQFFSLLIWDETTIIFL